MFKYIFLSTLHISQNKIKCKHFWKKMLILFIREKNCISLINMVRVKRKYQNKRAIQNKRYYNNKMRTGKKSSIQLNGT